jgi:hypothetical protein
MLFGIRLMRSHLRDTGVPWPVRGWQGSAQQVGKDLPVGRPWGTFDRYQVFHLRARGLSYRQIARQMRIGEGTVRRVLGSRLT